MSGRLAVELGAWHAARVASVANVFLHVTHCGVGAFRERRAAQRAKAEVDLAHDEEAAIGGGAVALPRAAPTIVALDGGVLW
jgi:hypothetical protein